ncbi:hypothetical protein MFUM_240010 [Methylacidiphilum fumariolicum SolV]|uniref:Uncharacterized protein n=2 Tax=Candidatus Methylacidiphilum fumarolicum TaxID=591154 RepID=I0JX94_METFB|nr:conserved protein of unknown function [Candidatus Methylacidiphilum fumarolicum]CCG91863.1 hypothetical protein MFUM_240010 [Methylacidiphilum fumariolicum SolV]
MNAKTNAIKRPNWNEIFSILGYIILFTGVAYLTLHGSCTPFKF